MAGKNQVTLTFAGDTAKLEQAFDRVGSAAKGMDTEVGKAGEGFDKLGEKADVGEQRIVGVKDTVDGFSTVLQGPGKQGLAAYIQGWADLSSGVANFLVPAGKALIFTVRQRVVALASAGATRTWAAAQRLLNVAFLTSPIGLAIVAVIALTAAIVVAWNRSETFRRIVTGAFNAVRNAAAAAFGWVRRNWPLLLGILTGPIGLAVVVIARNRDRILDLFRRIPGAIRGFFSGLASVVSAPFRAAVDAIRSIWNSTIGGKGFSFGGWDPPGPGSVPGFSIRIPTLHSGGIVPGPPGSEMLAILESGERVTPAGASDRVVLELRSSGTRLDDALVEILRRAIRVKGGNVQVVLGS